jgi:hypothetical protein
VGNEFFLWPKLKTLATTQSVHKTAIHLTRSKWSSVVKYAVSSGSHAIRSIQQLATRTSRPDHLITSDKSFGMPFLSGLLRKLVNPKLQKEMNSLVRGNGGQLTGAT